MAKKKEAGSSTAAKKSATRKIQFEFLDPDAEEVYLAGNFNCWDIHGNPMKKDKKGTWKASLALEPGRYEYRFIVDGQWRDDPACCECVPNEFGSANSVKTVD